MSYKKVTICSLLVGMLVGFSIGVMNNSLDYKLYHLRRKANCLNRKINRVLRNMSEDNLKKYKEEIIKGYENIIDRIDSLTIKDIKDKSNELVCNIIDSINDMKEKLIAYSR